MGKCGFFGNKNFLKFFFNIVGRLNREPNVMNWTEVTCLLTSEHTLDLFPFSYSYICPLYVRSSSTDPHNIFPVIRDQGTRTLSIWWQETDQEIYASVSSFEEPHRPSWTLTSRHRSCHRRANISRSGGQNLSGPRRSGSITQCIAASWLQPVRTIGIAAGSNMAHMTPPNSRTDWCLRNTNTKPIPWTFKDQRNNWQISKIL